MLAGILIDPPVSDPSARNAEPSHRLTPAPLDDPPGTRWTFASHGLRGVPQCVLIPKPPKANSTVWVLPVITAACRRRAWITGPSASHSSGNRLGEPA